MPELSTEQRLEIAEVALRLARDYLLATGRDRSQDKVIAAVLDQIDAALNQEK